jgi:GT2 family glycosyltransferase
MLDVSINHAVICLATYKRPAMLHATLTSLLNQNINFNYMVYVVENEAKNQEGLKVIQNFNFEHNLNWQCFVEEKQGNVHALNAVFAKALKENPHTNYFLMIDDDEVAASNWLADMVSSVKGFGIVGGPVHPLFARETKAKNHPLYNPAYSKSGEVPLIYGSGNCLITREVLEKYLPLDVTFNHLGGADADFFQRAKRDGVRFFWCNEAKMFQKNA